MKKGNTKAHGKVDSAKKAAKPGKSESRDISAYACRAMVYGAISGHGISRGDVEGLCRRFSDENPRVDVTKCPVVMFTDDGTPVNRAVVMLLSKYAPAGAKVSSADGKTVLVVGPAAREIVSCLDTEAGKPQKLKTKIRVECPFPVNRRLKCFGGRRVSDYINR